MDLFQISTLILMLIFYGTYFYKMFSQRKKGVKTDKLGKSNKELSVTRIELSLKIITYTIVLVEVISIILNARIINLKLLSIIGVFIFIISIITMSNSWRAGIPENEKTKLIKTGIYKLSRNPAFLGFDIMYLGILMAFFNPILLLFTVFTVVFLNLQILNEEKFLKKEFGEEYLEYKSNTRRYL